MNTFKNIIDKIKPVVYTWKKDKNKKKSFGVIAQDLLTIFPEDKYDIVQKQDDGYYAVCYFQLVPMLISELQELKRRILKLEETAANETSHTISNQ